jgi:hypothetical protein
VEQEGTPRDQRLGAGQEEVEPQGLVLCAMMKGAEKMSTCERVPRN